MRAGTGVKPVVLIGGASGTGKTTLARAVCQAYAIDHRISTGFIREIIRDQFSEQTYPLLFSYTFRAADPIRALVFQAQLLRRPVDLCIQRARAEGTSLVLEGNHLIPGLYRNADFDAYVMLGAPVGHLHRARLHSATHSRRTISDTDVWGARLIDGYLRGEAVRYGIPILGNGAALARIGQILRRFDVL
ncbi:MAG: hypothetical protein ACFCVA_18045 [Gammaproteobacteria bacterium]